MVKKLLFINLMSSLLFSSLFGFAGGDGSVGNPYQVSNAVELDSVRHFLNSNFIQSGDIDLGVAPWNAGSGWIPVGNLITPFTGSYDGGNYSISGLFINDNSNIKGLFGYVSGGILEKINMVSVDVSGGDYVGGLIGAIFENTAISDCTTSGIVNGLYDVGGFVGYSQSSTISNCTSLSTVTGVSSSGGLCGTFDNSNAINCSSSSNVTTTGYYAGGLIGYNFLNSSISLSDFDGSVTGDMYVGGLIGYTEYSAVTECNANSLINGNRRSSALIGGSLNDSISYCFSSGTINGDECGGIAGEIIGSIVINCSSNVTVNGQGWGLSGGLVGRCESSNVSNCFSSGSVSDDWVVGGLIGSIHSNSTVSDCYSNADASCTIWSVGGLLGESYDSDVINCYTIGAVTGPDYYGGLIGYKETSSITSSYWDKDTSGQSFSDGGTGKTTEEMKLQTTFSGWDFSTPLWNIHTSLNDGYPYLSMEGRVPVEAPQNISISYSAEEVTLSWDSVSGATGYKIYSSNEPYGTYTVDDNGSLNGTVWTVPSSYSKWFYKVTAINPTK